MLTIKNLLAENNGQLPEVLFPHMAAYQDREGSVICAECANRSLDPDEVPEFRPVSVILVSTDDETDTDCDQCSKFIGGPSELETE